MASPRVTALLAAILMFCGADIALGFCCGETFSKDLDEWGIVRVAAVLVLCFAAALCGYRYVMQNVPSVSPSWAIFTLASLLSLTYCVEICAMWLEHSGSGAIFLPYHRIAFFGNNIEITSYIVNFAPDEWPHFSPKELKELLQRVGPSSRWTNYAITDLPISLVVLLLSVMPCTLLILKMVGPNERDTRAATRAMPVKPHRCGKKVLSLGARLAILHSVLWLHWITVVFMPSEVRWSMRTAELALLSFPLGWRAIPVTSLFSSFETAACAIYFPALCANSLFCGYSVAWIWVNVLRRVSSRAVRRHTAGCCINCGYSLRGNVSGTCPECGTSCAYKIANERGEILK